MELASDQNTDEFLTAQGHVVLDLLMASEFSRVAEKYGYAMAYERLKSKAIESDFTTACDKASIKIDANQILHREISVVRYMPSDRLNLTAAVSCYLSTGASEYSVNLEMVVFAIDNKFSLSIEDITDQWMNVSG